jgi:FMN phosphatase YigB (HAD superfamily)
MKVVLFDLGDTLVESLSTGYRLIDGAMDLLRGLDSINNTNNKQIVMGIVSDTHAPSELPLSPNEKLIRKNEVLQILENTNIIEYFNPTESCLTLSSDLGYTKSENLNGFFDNALNKLSNNSNLNDIIFVTELEDHIIKAKSLGVKAYYYNPLGLSENDDTINKLIDIIPKIQVLLNSNDS